MKTIETQRWDDSIIGKPETYGYSTEFTVAGKNYYADISNRVHPVETMIFPCTKKWKPNFGKPVYVAYHDEPSEDNLRYDIRKFLKGLEKKA